jgi:hypothetical protein
MWAIYEAGVADGRYLEGLLTTILRGLFLETHCDVFILTLVSINLGIFITLILY